jgi:hypothetical protein
MNTSILGLGSVNTLNSSIIGMAHVELLNAHFANEDLFLISTLWKKYSSSTNKYQISPFYLGDHHFFWIHVQDFYVWPKEKMFQQYKYIL